MRRFSVAPSEGSAVFCFARSKRHCSARWKWDLADVVDRADIRVIQRRRSFSLATKSLQSLVILGYVFG